MSTHCKNCYFSNIASSDKPCEFNIINEIKQDKNISIKDDFFYIPDYYCKYGFSKQQYEKNKDELSTIDLKEEILKRAIVPYYLVIDHRYDVSTKQLCEAINNLQIPPKFISILCYEIDSRPFIKDLNEYLSPNLKWKTHNFLTKTMTLNMAIKTALDTSSDIKTINYLWINRSDHIYEISQSHIIEKINYLVNIKQPVCNLIKSKLSNDLSTVFMNTQTYSYITKNISQMLDDVLKELGATILYYDN